MYQCIATYLTSFNTIFKIYLFLKAFSGDEAILKLLEVSDDIVYRLSNVAKLEDQSLRCDIFFPNFTISASFWDGFPLNPIFSCDLTNENSYATASGAFLRFPNNIQGNDMDHSYILLPDEILLIGKAHMASGVLIPATHLIQRLLPGGNNTMLVLVKYYSNFMVISNRNLAIFLQSR